MSLADEPDLTREPATLSAILAAARKQRGWTLRQAERHSGVPNAHISQIETGAIKRPEAATLIRLADAYDLPPAGLMAMAGRAAELAEIQALRDHIDADHAVMVQLGIVADAAVQMLEHINMDTVEDRELHARAVGALRARLGELAAKMKEANEAAQADSRA